MEEPKNAILSFYDWEFNGGDTQEWLGTLKF